jgi:polyferredoxin
MWIGILLGGLWPAAAPAAQNFSLPEFETGHKLPTTDVPRQPWMDRDWLDLSVFVGTLGAGVWLVHYQRSRRGVFWLTLFALAYFGFYRQGCICPVGSIGNVSLAAGTGYALPWLVGIFFAIPLVLSLFYGRVFCAGVCPLGAIQDAVLWKPVTVPGWLEQALGLFAYLYLGLAVVFAAVGSDFIICRWDPFVGFFRFSGSSHMLFIGGVLLLMSVFVGRTYCRFICPYSALLRMLSLFSWKKVSITPTECIDCRLCESSCPFGAIRKPTPAGRVLPTPRDRSRLGWLIGATPAMACLLAALGYLSAPVFASTDFTVKLAHLVADAEKSGATDPPDEVKGWKRTLESPGDLYSRAARIERSFEIGMAIFGAYAGVVIGLRLIAHARRKRLTGYTADPSSCVACARCYAYCPIEIERRTGKRPQLPTEPQPAQVVVV